MTETSSGGRDSLSSWIWPWIFILALALALFMCLWMHLSGPRSIQAAVSECVAPVIGSTSLKTGNVEVHGRDVHLNGEVDARLDQEALVTDLSQLDCTREVVNNLVAVEREPSNVQITAFGDSVMIMGGLPSQADVDLVHAAVASRYNANGVENQIQVLKQGSEAGWLSGVDEYVGHMALADPSGIDINDKRVTLTGVVRSEDIKLELGDKAAAAFLGAMPIDNQIEVKSPRSSASLQYEITESGVVLSGEMYDQKGIDEAVAAAATAFAEDKIDNQLVVNSDVKPALWVPALGTAMTALAQIPGAKLSAEDAGVTLEGVVAAPERRQGVEDALRASLGDIAVDNRIAVDIPQSSATLKLAFPRGFEGRVAVSGSLASTDAVATTLSAVSGSFAEDRIDNSLVVSQESQPAAWLDGVSTLLNAFSGADNGSIEIDDANVVVSGLVDGNDKRDAIVAAATALGVGAVDDQLDVRPRGSAMVDYLYDDGRVELNGELADADQIAAAVSAAEGAFGADAVSNNLAVGERLNDPVWLDAVNASLETLSGFDNAQLTASDSGIDLAGVVADASNRDAVIATLRGTGDLEVQDSVQVLPYTSPRVSFRKSAGALRIDGIVATEGELDAVAAAASEVFGADNVDNAVTVGERVAPMMWLDGINAALVDFAALESGMLTASDERISINGIVDEQSKKDAAIASMAAAAGDIAQSEAIEVKPYQASSIYYTVSNNKIELAGTLSSRQEVAAATEAAEATFGADNVNGALLVGERHQPAAWLANINAAVPALMSLESGALSADEDGISVTGVTDEEQKKVDLLGALEGDSAAWAIDETVVVSPYAASNIDYAIDGDHIQLTGTLSSPDEVAAAVAAAESAYGAENVGNELIVGERHHPAQWLAGINGAAATLKHLENGQLSATDTGVSISGLTDDDAKKAAIVEALSASVGDGALSEAIEVRPYAGANLRLESDGTKIQLAGTLSNEQEVSDAMAAASAVYGADYVDSELVVGERYQPAAWLAGVTGSLAEFYQLEQGILTADDSGITISGIVDVEDKKGQLIAMLGNSADDIVVSEDIAVMPYAAPSLSYRIEDAQVELEGTLASQTEVDSAGVAANAVFGVDNIDNRLIVGERHRPATWLDALNGAVVELGNLERGTLVASDDGISVDGITDEESKKDAIVTSISGAAGEIAFSEAITVVPYESGAIRYQFDAPTIRLEGVLGSVAEVDSANAAAIAAFGEDNVDSQLIVGERHREAAWLAPVNDSMAELAAFERAVLEANESSISITGLTDEDEKKSSVLKQLGTAGDAIELTESIEVVPYESPAVQYQINDGAIRLEGVLSSGQEIEHTVTAAAVIFGADNVSSGLRVGERHREALWLDPINGAVDEGRHLESGVISASDDAVSVRGVTDSESKKERIVAGLREAAGSIAFAETIEVKPYGQSAILYTVADGRIRLTGTLSTEEEATMAAESATQAFGEDNVDNELQVGERHRPADWLAQLGARLGDLKQLERGELAANDRAISVTGETDEPEKRDAVIAAMRDGAGSIPLSDEITVIPRESSEITYRFKNENSIDIAGVLGSAELIESAKGGARDYGGASGITSSLSVDRVSDASWLPGVMELLSEIRTVESAVVTANDNTVMLGGTVSTVERRDQIGELAGKLLPEAKIDNRILVVVPVPEKTITQALTDLNLPGIQFETDSAELREGSREILDGVVRVLADFPDVRVEIAGHTDTDGEDVYNIDLSSRRTETVLGYLTRAGIRSDRLSTRGYGESRPIADNETEEGKAINRRIEFNVLD